MTLEQFIAARDYITPFDRSMIRDAYEEGRKVGKAQENRRLHRMHQEWQKILDNLERK
jgi:hypothetical protein